MQIKQRIRSQNLPVGLLNIGNTCYFNSLLQIYYSLPHFVTKILSFPGNLKKKDFKGKDKKTKQIHSGLLLIAELKEVFGRMAIGN
jgi:ubiquitin C-terminal hydrolase